MPHFLKVVLQIVESSLHFLPAQAFPRNSEQSPSLFCTRPTPTQPSPVVGSHLLTQTAVCQDGSRPDSSHYLLIL